MCHEADVKQLKHEHVHMDVKERSGVHMDTKSVVVDAYECEERSGGCI
jgi:hypothetical protein